MRSSGTTWDENQTTLDDKDRPNNLLHTPLPSPTVNRNPTDDDRPPNGLVGVGGDFHPAPVGIHNKETSSVQFSLERYKKTLPLLRASFSGYRRGFLYFRPRHERSLVFGGLVCLVSMCRGEKGVVDLVSCQEYALVSQGVFVHDRGPGVAKP